MAGNDNHRPYRGTTPALTDLLAGQVQVMFDVTPSSLPHIRAGKLRPLAATSATRLELMPDIPTVGEFLPGYEVSFWYGIGAPRNTPAEIVNRLNKEINAVLADPKTKARRLWRHAVYRLARRSRSAHRRRNREVGQGGAGGQHQAVVTRLVLHNVSICESRHVAAMRRIFTTCLQPQQPHPIGACRNWLLWATCRLRSAANICRGANYGSLTTNTVIGSAGPGQAIKNATGRVHMLPVVV